MALVKGGGGEQKYPKKVNCSPAWVPPAAAQPFVLDSPKIGMLVRQIRIVLLLPLLLLASVSVLAQAPRLTLSVDQGVQSGEPRLARGIDVIGLSGTALEGIAVSPDGRWLLNGGVGFDLWEIDSARGIITRRASESLPRPLIIPRGLAVSPDSSLVFVPSNTTTGIVTVWHLNADDGSLEEAARYTEGGTDAAGNTVRGLTDVWDAVLSPDGRLLFVTNRGKSDSAGGALSVWSVNPSGTLVQTDVHVSAGASDTEGLNRAAGAAVTPDGRLLFVGSAYSAQQLDKSTLSIWRVNAEASTVSFVRALQDRQRLAHPQTIALHPSGRLLFVINPDAAEADNSLSVYRVDAAEEDLESVGPRLMGENPFHITATEEVLIASNNVQISLFQINEDDTISGPVSSLQGFSPNSVAASPAGGLVFTNSVLSSFLGVWQVLGIPRVPAGQEVRVMVNAESALDTALTVMVQARQGSRVRMAAATLMPSDTQAEAVFSGSDLGQGEWIFSASVPADMADIVDVSAARATLRISGPLVRLENLSGVIPEGADLNIRVSTEGMVPVAGDTEVTLQAAQEGAQPRTAMGLLREGQTSVTVTFAGRESLIEGDWVLSASSILPTDANSTLAVTVGPPLIRLTLSVDQGVSSGEMRLVQTDTKPGLGTEEGLAVSPDGRWLLAGGISGRGFIRTLEIDSVRGIATPVELYTGLGGRSLAVSRDSSLVFASDNAFMSTISVWRLNADDGSLEGVAQYTGGGTDAAGNTVRGLISTHDVVLSPDDRLLFVTSNGESNSNNGALSVWRVSPSGTLVQTDVHVSGGGADTEGLNAIAGAAVTPDGRLLFAGSFYDSGFLDHSTLGIWRVNAEASAVSFVRTLSDRRMLRRPRVVTLGPSGRFLFVSSQVGADAETDPLSVYEVNAAEENLASVASYGEDISGDAIGLAVTREVLAVAEFTQGSVALWQRNDNGTLRFASRHDSASPVSLAASPAGGLVFSSSSSNDGSVGISVWRVQGIPRVPAGQEVRVMVNAESALGSALTVMVQARQGSRVSMAAATLMPSDIQAEAVFSGRDLGQGEWIFSASVPTDMADVADVSTARATLRIGGPLVRLENLSGVIPEGADLNIRISTEGHPVLEDAEVTLRATQQGAQPRTVMGLLREEQAEVTVTFAGRQSLTEGDWVLSAESSVLSTDENSGLDVTVRPPLPRLTLSVNQGVSSGEMRLVQTDANTGLPAGDSEGLAVSPDGRWLLASGGGRITVWEIDSVRGIVTQRSTEMGTGLGGRGLAVSRDSRLVFTSDRASTSTISVWRLNADNGGLEEVAKYTGGETDAAENTVRGLTVTHAVVLSPDERLLFVTSNGRLDDEGVPFGGALSVWNVNPSGTLVQTNVHVSAGAEDTEGLNQIAGAAVTPDGRLLFAGSFHDFGSFDRSTLGIWRVNAEASTVSFVRTRQDTRMLRRPRVVTLGPAGRFLFVSSQVLNDAQIDPLSVYRVNAAEEDLVSLASYGNDIEGRTIGLAATREVLAVAEEDGGGGGVSLWQRNNDGTLRFVRRHASFRPIGLAASPAGGLVFSSSNEGSEGIIVWQVQGIPRVPAGQEVRVMVNAEQAPDSARTVMVQARQGSRVSMAAATLMPSDTQAAAVFSGRDLGQGEWIFSASGLTDTAKLRIGNPLIRLENLSGRIPEGADLNIRISTEGHPVLEDAQVTLRATQEGAQPRTVMGLLQEGETSVTVTFAGENALTGGDWVLSAESSILFTDANSVLTVTVIPLPKLTLSVDQGVSSGEMRLVQTDNKRLASGTEEGLAVSPDGRWLLASGGGGITVWEIDSVRGMVTQSSDRMGAGLGGRGLAVSRDSNFVFTSDGASTSTISVWRLDADDGGLEEVAKYTGGGTDAAENTVRGLSSVWDVVLSPDDRLLFVTSAGVSDNGALSVWSVNTSGTLVQTDVHPAGDSNTEGLNAIAGAAVTPDGRLLFAGSTRDRRLSLWRVNAEASTVSFVRTIPDNIGLRRPRVVTLGPAGRFLFVSNSINSSDNDSDSLSVYKVNAAEEDLTLVDSYGGLGVTFGLAVTREVLALVSRSQSNVTLWQRNASGTLSFVSRHASGRAHGLAASPAGGLVFSSSNSGSEGISVWRVQGIPRVPAGQEVRVMVNAEPTLGSALTVTVQARQGSRVSTATATLMPSNTQAEAVFSGSDLGPGEWIFSASVPADMADVADVSTARATLRISGPLVSLEMTGGSAIVASDGMITLILRVMPALSSTVMVTVAVTDEDNNTISEQLEALSSSLRLTFRASDLGTGRLRFTARGPAGVLEDSEAEVTVLVDTAAGVVLSANPEEDVFPGDEVRLSAEVLSGSDLAGIDVVLEVAVAPPDGSTRSNVLIPVSAETSTGTLTFIPDAVPGTWNFNVIESDGISVSATLTVMVAAVVPLPLDFNNPSDGVSADDLVLLLRYERLCAGGDSRPLPANCSALGSEALAAGLAFDSSSDRLADLQNVQLPDVTGTGIGSVQTLAILLQALANVQDELLLPAAASSAEAEQARDARLRIIRQLLGRE